MDVIAKVEMFLNRGSAYEKQIFIKGNKYKYFAESSSWNNHEVQREAGTGQPSTFNEHEFYKYFQINH